MPISLPSDTIEQRAALIRAQYPAGDLPGLAKQLGVSMNRLMTLACRLEVKRDRAAMLRVRTASRTPPQGKAIRAQLAAWATRPNGVANQEVADAINVPLRAVSGVVSSMQRTGQLHSAAISHRRVRYFASAEAAEQFLARLGQGKRRTATGAAPAVHITRAPGPAYLPGEPVITQHTKRTIAPPPKQALRSNTHLFSA